MPAAGACYVGQLAVLERQLCTIIIIILGAADMLVYVTRLADLSTTFQAYSIHSPVRTNTNISCTKWCCCCSRVSRKALSAYYAHDVVLTAGHECMLVFRW
jgi:uncharacterized protein (DUF2237 family)